MLDLNRRAVKVISGSLAAVMLNFALLPAAAFAAHHRHQPPRYYQPRYRQVRYYQPRYYRPYYYKPYHHHHHHDSWTKRDTATVAGLAAVIGLLALANRKHRDNIAPAEVTYATYNNQTGSHVAYADFAVEVQRLVNVERAKVGAAPLRLSSDLMDAATVRAEEITRSFSHQRPDGSSCFTLVRNQNHTMGENIAAGSATPEAVIDQWMHSKGHRENMLDKRFKELGVGHYYKEGSSYGHYWIQMFRG